MAGIDKWARRPTSKECFSMRVRRKFASIDAWKEANKADEATTMRRHCPKGDLTKQTLSHIKH